MIRQTDSLQGSMHLGCSRPAQDMLLCVVREVDTVQLLLPPTMLRSAQQRSRVLVSHAISRILEGPVGVTVLCATNPNIRVTCTTNRLSDVTSKHQGKSLSLGITTVMTLSKSDVERGQIRCSPTLLSSSGRVLIYTCLDA